MNFRTAKPIAFVLLGFFFVTATFADVGSNMHRQGTDTVYQLFNGYIRLSVTFRSGALISEDLRIQGKESQLDGTSTIGFTTDGDIELDIMWTGWQAPGKVHNADNPLLLTKENFKLTEYKEETLEEGEKELILNFQGTDTSFEMTVTYLLAADDYFIKKKIALRDPRKRNHFLRWISPLKGELLTEARIIKAGGFGEPMAILTGNGGAFFGLEYPAGTNRLKKGSGGKIIIESGQEMGVQIGESMVESEWFVMGLSPDQYVKLWFNRYLDSVRVAPLRPYLLYNSWYDVRAPEYTDRPEDVMNEANVLRIISDFKREMYEKRGLSLDAFVLDDGWDVYRSNWVLREKEFPHGLAPLVEALAEMNTSLGMWFGPIGGYSHRDWRIEWMTAHGYETVNDQLCIAGKNYHDLFKRRTVDFVKNDKVAYYKWDGIQFSCSQPDHGHPVGIYSRRAVMESVIDLCKAVRAENPQMFLNITSGTWLSPWWMKYANMIWMQGSDYGYADVPSISKRDSAITYRDVVLYEDFGKNDFWFPISNLMTHGIIKGHLQKLGGEAEPLDKFTDNAILYFARGVSMWELYISPNLLSDGEWDAIAKAIRWAKDRFPVLKSTEMIGGDPGKREAYGYAHFNGDRGILAVRNPFIVNQSLPVSLSPACGINPKARELVLERVYPTRWISPRLYSAGDSIEIALQGYETAIYEIYPLAEATEPLLAGVIFNVEGEAETEYKLNVVNTDGEIHVLNPDIVRSVKKNGEDISLNDLAGMRSKQREAVSQVSSNSSGSTIGISFRLGDSAKNAKLAILIEPGKKSDGDNDPVVSVAINGKSVETSVEEQKGRWSWHLVPVSPGLNNAQVDLTMKSENQQWRGLLSAWLIYDLDEEAIEVTFETSGSTAASRPMPPLPRPAGEMRHMIKLAETKLSIK